MAAPIKSRDAAFLQRWHASRAQGQWRYILVSGVLSWGLPMFVAMTFFVSRPPVITPRLLCVSAVLWLLGGAAFRGFVWLLSERRYKRLTADSALESAT